MLSDKNPSKAVRMSQAHEAVSRIKVMNNFNILYSNIYIYLNISMNTINAMFVVRTDTFFCDGNRNYTHLGSSS